MIRDLTLPAIAMGSLAAFVGYAASATIVLAGLAAVGASPAQMATGLFFATLGMGLCSIVLPALTRTPSAIAWSTPGAALLAASPVPAGGLAEAVGALAACAVLIVLAGLVPALARLVAAIPRPLASALLAGVLMRLCLAPALALGTHPALVAPVVLAWACGLAWNRLAAMPLAVIAALAALALAPGGEGGLPLAGAGLPALAPLMPTLSPTALVSLALPLFLVTMAGQNIPGFAVLELNGYPVARRLMLTVTGLVSLAFAPFGSIPLNMSAITAAMMAGEDAGPDPARRYWAAIVSGLVYTALAFAAGLVVAVVAGAPIALITAVAGLALIPALAQSLRAAFAEPAQSEAPALTFVLAASGMTLAGLGGPVWAILAGGLVWGLKAAALRRGG